MQKTNISREALTKQYQSETLPEGWYYFSCGGSSEFIGKLVKPTPVAIGYAIEQGQPKPQQCIHSCPGLFVGALKTISVLAPVPTYNETLS